MSDEEDKDLPCYTCKNAGTCMCCQRGTCEEFSLHLYEITLKEIKEWECYERENS